VLSTRETALVLTALRHWQQSHDGLLTNDALWDIATDGGKFEALGPVEIDHLCHRLNFIRNAAARYVLYDFDADELATTLIYGSLESAKQDADQLGNVVVLQLPRPGQDNDSVCECQEPGSYFYSGVPGILAHMGAGGVATGTKVHRCDQCQRYPSDEAALAKLKELGLA
jgi:hypothetical protein